MKLFELNFPNFRNVILPKFFYAENIEDPYIDKIIIYLKTYGTCGKADSKRVKGLLKYIFYGGSKVKGNFGIITVRDVAIIPPKTMNAADFYEYLDGRKWKNKS